MDTAFGSRLRKIRGARGFTLSQLSNATGISNQTLSAYENGNREPTLRRLDLLANALGVTIDQLAGRERLTLTVD